MYKINGVLLPGGSNWFNQSNGYAEAGEHIMQLAVELNHKGRYMPVWGICLGMEFLIYMMANNKEHRVDCNAKNMILPIEFREDYKSSRLFGTISYDVAVAMTTENVTSHWHRFCYTEQDFRNNPLTQIWRVLSVNHDWHGSEFISTVEHVMYPFYGVQFHPEKPQFEFHKSSIPHTAAAIVSSQFFADFFVSEARKSNQSFANESELAMMLIYNYKPEYTGILKSIYTQQYLFSNVEMGLEVRHAHPFG
ncbi:hypothetical protein KR200_006745 [Drosophila serrata]|nr:hypothetical protein KR200_006745 [Drosophila serrata]